MSVSLIEQSKKHAPWVELIDGKLIIKVWFEIDHPMLPEHYISSIDILQVSKAGLLRVKGILFNPWDKAMVEFDIVDFKPWVYKIQARCNLHGSWENEILL